MPFHHIMLYPTKTHPEHENHCERNVINDQSNGNKLSSWYFSFHWIPHICILSEFTYIDIQRLDVMKQECLGNKLKFEYTSQLFQIMKNLQFLKNSHLYKKIQKLKKKYRHTNHTLCTCTCIHKMQTQTQ